MFRDRWSLWGDERVLDLAVTDAKFHECVKKLIQGPKK